jgi:hypothetical protein
MVIEIAKDDPEFIVLVIAELEASGEIEQGELDYLKRITKRWKAIAEANLNRGKLGR